MTPMEITLLIIGVIIFAASFFIKDKSPVKSEKDIENEQKEIRQIMERELDGMKLRVNDMTDETVEYAMEKAERSLEKVSNEKIMAVSDYSNMVIEEIDKSHKEVMFLYDMLSDKQADVKNSVRKAEATVKEVEDLSTAAQTSSEEFKRDLDDYSTQKLNEVRQAADQSITPFIPEVVYRQESAPVPMPEAEPVPERPMTAIEMLRARQNEAELHPVFNALNSDCFASVDVADVKLVDPADVLKPLTAPAPAENTAPQKAPSRPEKQSEQKKPASSFMRGFGGGKTNNNQKIIELYEQGLSTVEIARDLNLGVGEVKLVIDLLK
ncbi:MAG: hypothetical protein IJ873_01695 [Lachnospiraceae bacterium]|nr:hypothetical protein [Lachnospiraceae bacterium]